MHLQERIPWSGVGDQLAKFTWRHLRVIVYYETKAEKVILDNVSGYALPGRMLAIMGPSGSGKSTLLDLIAGRLSSSAKNSGEVLLNGRRAELPHGVSAFVGQDVLLIGSLSVRETLLYTALLRLPRTLSKKEKVSRVDKLINELGLTNVKGTRVGNQFIRGIDTGHRRLVYIGNELIRNPAILFLDEPTSDLDSASALIVMSYIRELVEGNRTAISVIHQPSPEVFQLFDDLCLLAGGEVVYFGAANEALRMFEASGLGCPAFRNPVDHFLHAIDPTAVEREEGDDANANRQRLTMHYRQNLLPAVEAQVAKNSSLRKAYKVCRNHPSVVYRIYLLAWRMYFIILRNVFALWYRIGLYLALYLGSIYFDANKAINPHNPLVCFVMGTVYMTLQGRMGYLLTEADLMVFEREIQDGCYSAVTYIIAYAIASVPYIYSLTLIAKIIFAYYNLIDMREHQPYFIFMYATLYESHIFVDIIAMWFKLREQTRVVSDQRRLAATIKHKNSIHFMNDPVQWLGHQFGIGSLEFIFSWT